MAIFHTNEHRSCPNYEAGSAPTMEVIKIRKNDHFHAPAPTYAIVALLEGNLTYTIEQMEEHTTEIQAGQLVLLSPHKSFELKAKQNAKTLLIRLKEIVRFCEFCSFEILTRETASSVMREELAQEKTHLLTANQGVGNYLSGVAMYIENGISCRSFFDLKTKELFHLLHAFYPKEKLVLFFREILSRDICFSSFVICNYKKYNNVSEFAAAVNMSRCTFERQFRKAFNMPVYQWMKEHKAKDIQHAICTERTPLKELAIRFGFSSKSSFSVFCRNKFGVPPGELRRRARFSTNNNKQPKMGNERQKSANQEQ